jgi:chromosomal replication initiator protein
VDERADLAAVWDRIKARLDDDTARPQQRAWITLTRPIGLVEDTALFAVPNQFARDFFEERMRPLLTELLSAELGTEVRVAATVDERAEESADGLAVESDRGAAGHGVNGAVSANGAAAHGVADELDTDGDEPEPWSPRPSVPTARGSGGDREARLNPKYTFDTFVIGSSNRFTHAAAVAVAEAPARAYNPLFIYGDSGLGKTHLLHAIGHYAQRLLPGLRTRYVSSEEFTNDFINSVRDDKMQAFQSRYRRWSAAVLASLIALITSLVKASEET